MKFACTERLRDVGSSVLIGHCQLNEESVKKETRAGRSLHEADDAGARLLELDVVHDVTKGLRTLLHLGQLRLAQLLADQMRDALLADAHRDAEENLVRDAVPAFRERRQREHTPLYIRVHTHTHTRTQCDC